VFDLANKFNPIAVTLDVKLPDASGWRILDLFKNDINFRHIPVHLISGEENRLLGYAAWCPKLPPEAIEE
jgi:CheY-like chemotaxis protein